jgi:hypothetical protein
LVVALSGRALAVAAKRAATRSAINLFGDMDAGPPTNLRLPETWTGFDTVLGRRKSWRLGHPRRPWFRLAPDWKRNPS